MHLPDLHRRYANDNRLRLCVDSLLRQVSSTAPSPAHRPLEGAKILQRWLCCSGALAWPSIVLFLRGELLWPWQLKITDFNSAKRVGACNGKILSD